MRLAQQLTLTPLPYAKCVSVLTPLLIIAACDKDGAEPQRGATYKCKWIALWLQYFFNLFWWGILASKQEWKSNGDYCLAVHFHPSSPPLRPEDQVSKKDITVSESPYTIIPKTADWLHIYPATRSRQLSFVTLSNPLCLKFGLCFIVFGFHFPPVSSKGWCKLPVLPSYALQCQFLLLINYWLC